ncbi:MAG TPA: FHA domain-containing protein [Thermoanaerobaculaceae bacterium]|nr:FHA domain-containing protein [Thermoanaerobaculaceae bacterium]
MTFPLVNEKLVVGRSRSCDIRLKEDTVSRLHAALMWQEGSLLLEDLGSSNGTFVNGERVLSPHPLAIGDVVRFGALRGSVESIDAPEPSPAARTQADARYDTVGVGSGRPAGLGWRLLASLLDLVLFAAGSAIAFAPLGVTVLVERYFLAPDALPPSLQTKSLLAGGCAALWVIFAWYYVVHGWARRGGTPGLRICGLRLLDWRRRTPIGYARAVLRVFASLVTLLTLGLGWLVVPFRRDRKALHDLLAGTMVAHRDRVLGAAAGSA